MLRPMRKLRRIVPHTTHTAESGGKRKAPSHAGRGAGVRGSTPSHAKKIRNLEVCGFGDLCMPLDFAAQVSCARRDRIGGST